MHILFVNYHHLDSNSGVHIFNLANELSLLGVTCTVCVPDQKDTVEKLGTRRFEVFTFEELSSKPSLQMVDLIHAWTPREGVRKMTEALSVIFNAPFAIHLEDNEEAILQANLGMPSGSIWSLSSIFFGNKIPDRLIHPIQYKKFLKNALGITVIMDTLREFVPPGKMSEVIWAGYETGLNWNCPPDENLRQRLKLGEDEFVVVYTGNVHVANYREVFSLYLAIGLLNRRGIRTRLLRTGTDYVKLYDDSLKVLDVYCLSLGHVSRVELPSIISLADGLVQPGKLDKFNAYRFPSKIPEYLASGKPVILPATNIGRFLKGNEEAILLKEGNALEIAQVLESLFLREIQGNTIGIQGRRFAETNLKWRQIAIKLLRFYQVLLDKQATKKVDQC